MSDETMVSDCCGADAGEWEDVGVCPQCKEHCEFVPEGYDSTPYCIGCGSMTKEACVKAGCPGPFYADNH